MVSAVRKDEVYTAPQPRKQNRIQKKPDDRTDAMLRTRGRVVTALITTVILLCMFATVARYAELSDRQIEIDRIQTAIEKEQSRAGELALCLNQAQDIDVLEEYARTDLDMEYGDRASVTYVTLPEAQPPTQHAQAPEGDGLFTMLAQLLD
jgi:cell division protein FtsL